MVDETALSVLMREHLRQTLLATERHRDPGRLTQFGEKWFSQGDEDGIITEIFRRIGTTDRFFVEIGIGDGSENNSLHLLLNGWRGVWIDGWSEGVARARSAFAPFVDSGRLVIEEAHVTAENVGALLAALHVPANPDLFSLDIDGNDYYVFGGLDWLRPRVTVLEYNASLGPTARWAMPYMPDHRWDESMVFGASLPALVELAHANCSALVGCSLAGTNAFFVSKDEDLSLFKAPFTATEHYEPPRYFLLPMFSGHKSPGREDSRLARGLLD